MINTYPLHTSWEITLCPCFLSLALLTSLMSLVLSKKKKKRLNTNQDQQISELNSPINYQCGNHWQDKDCCQTHICLSHTYFHNQEDIWGHLCFPWRRAGQHSPVFLPGESHGQRSLTGYNPCGHKGLDTTEANTFTSLSSNGISTRINI